MNTNQNDKIALITGGSRGLGRSMALHLADRGVDSIITYHSSAAEADEVVKAVVSKGRRAMALRLDVGDTASFGAFAEAVRNALARTWGRDRFDFLVNNGGTGASVPFLETSEATFDEMMRVHLKGPFFLTQKLAPLLADGGRIVNVSSALTRLSFPGSSVYAVMKGGLEVLTRYLAREFGSRQITANTIAPGAVATDFRGGALRNNPEMQKQIASMAALGRVAVADDVGGAVALLLAPENHWITGQRIEASGGLFL